MFSSRRIGSNLVLLFAFLSLVTLGVFLSIALDLDRRILSQVQEEQSSLFSRALQDTWEHKTLELTTLLSQRFTQPLRDLRISEMNQIAELAAEGESIVYVYVHDAEGRTLVDASSEGRLLGEIPPDAFARKAVAAERAFIQTSQGIFEAVSPVSLGGRRLGTVRVGFSPERIHEDAGLIEKEVASHIREVLKRRKLSFVTAAFFVLMLSTSAGILFARHIAAPIRELALSTKKVAGGDLGHRIQVVGRDELGEVAASFNQMTESLQRTLVSRDYVESIVSSMMSALIVTSPDGTITLTNRATQDMLGYREEQLRGMPLDGILGPEVPLYDGTSSGEGQDSSGGHVETTLLAKDGRRVPVFFSASVVRSKEGDLRGIVCGALDITLRKKAEAAIADYTRRLEHSNQMKDLFTDVLSHDLLNPAGLISHMSTLMIQRGVTSVPEGLDMIQRNARKLVEMIQSAAAYARVDSTAELEKKEVDLFVMLSTVVERMKPGLQEKDISVKFEPHGEAPALVNPLMEDVFDNLLSNALKYSPPSTTVTVAIGDLGDFWLVSLADQGEGIPDQYKESVFERFRRGKKEGVKGSGLGLAIARRIVDLHRGAIWVEDAPEGGSIFFVKLPKGEASRAGAGERARQTREPPSPSG